MALKPWYKVVTPREDLREGKPLDAEEFAVHLDQVREGRAPDDYKVPERFFERTYLTQGLRSFSAEVIRRLSGEKTETSAIFHMITQFGGGKTHGLTLLYHLTKQGPAADKWPGVRRILEAARGTGTLLNRLNYSSPIGRDSGQAADAFKLLKMFVKGKGAFQFERSQPRGRSCRAYLKLLKIKKR